MKGFHVGEYIQDEMEARGWTTGDVAVRMTDDEEEQAVWWCAIDMTIAMSQADEARNYTLGKDMADALSRAFGTSAELWMRLHKAWRIANGFEKAEGT